MHEGISFLVGNGFNKLLANLVSKEDISERLEEISVLYNKFSKLFDEIMKEYDLKTQEEAIELFYSALAILNAVITNSLNPKEDWRICLDEIKEELDKEVTARIFAVIDEFISDETNGFYGKLRKEFKSYGFFVNKESVKQNKNKLFIFTTNYDGCVDIFFRFNDNDGFLFYDLFNRSACPEYTEDYVCFDEFITPEAPLLFHLHGSYKFFVKREGFRYITIKLRNYKSLDFRSLIPVIIYNAPKMKEELIGRFQVLDTYFNFFKKNLRKNTRKLVIIGQSLSSDPHILDAISQSYHSIDEIVIMDVDDQLEEVKNRILKQVKQKFRESIALDKFRLINTKELDNISMFNGILEDLITN